MSNPTIDKITTPKGWHYKPRYVRYERKHGYRFEGISASDGKKYQCVMKAPNPIDAAMRLRPLEESVKLFKERL